MIGIGLRVTIILALLGVSTASAHDGESHAVEPVRNDVGASRTSFNPGALITTAARLGANGAVMLAKPAQRALGITTQAARVQAVPHRVELAGQVIADPRHSGRIEAAQAGTIEAATHGLPNLGQRVRRGEILGYLRPAFTTLERARHESELAEINRDLSLLEHQLKRLNVTVDNDTARLKDIPNPGLAQGAGSTIPYITVKANYDATRERKRVMENALAARQPLVAPTDGVVSSSRAYVGKVMQQSETIFEIVDPAHLWIEALSYDLGLGDAIVGAEASVREGVVLPLSFRGQGYQLREQAVPLQFALNLATAGVAVGQPVRVRVETRAQTDGAVLPLAAIARRAGNETWIWVHEGAERFVPRKVSAQDHGEGQVVVAGDIHSGDRIVTVGVAALERFR